MNKLFARILSLFYPNRCVACGRVQKEICFCDDCRKRVRLSPVGSCPRCGGDRGKCDCKTTEFAFDGMSAPFLYTDSVRQGLLNLKFYRRPDVAGYFGRVMAEKVTRDYGGIRFDAVVPVPMTDAGRKARGYNQAELLAKEIAEILEIPLMPNALIKVKDTAVQHKLGRKERFENVRGAYEADGEVRGKCLLLVDDIRTTGATLHECSRVLKRAGASSVFCAIAAVSRQI